MRSKERISVFLDNVDLMELLTSTWGIYEEYDSREIVKLIGENWSDIKRFWLKNQDLRFSQVLIYFGIVENISGVWYYKEEYDILNEQVK